ncbi:hypothetical protein KIN20_037183 [Parelaphostrongylus tenuis]|uniref:Uncharacterized protein n=1 Tax=Parelaphostrongylus tenuis TaxID=148309 RepID=A0AAD5RDL0_PARTN|nr:hypothetical protein KIN20_037183 [Parelaphostrongylus tenuis]
MRTPSLVYLPLRSSRNSAFCSGREWEEEQEEEEEEKTRKIEKFSLSLVLFCSVCAK